MFKIKLRNSWRQQDENQKLLIEGQTIHTITKTKTKNEKKKEQTWPTIVEKTMHITIVMKQHEHK
jgi:hypothetical protein